MRIINDSTSFKGKVSVINNSEIKTIPLKEILHTAKYNAGNARISHNIEINKIIKDKATFCTGEVMNILSADTPFDFPAKKAIVGSLAKLPEALYAITIKSDFQPKNKTNVMARERTILVGGLETDNLNVFDEKEMQKVLIKWLMDTKKWYKNLI